MGRIRGFSLKHRIATIFRRRRFPSRMGGRISRAVRCIKRKAESILRGKIGYVEMGKEGFLDIPKGQIAVYVGRNGGDFERMFVPIVYVNHPLFGDLLKESEKEFGFDQPGGLTIPCHIAEFESVQTRIEAGRPTRNLLFWKKT